MNEFQGARDFWEPSSPDDSMVLGPDDDDSSDQGGPLFPLSTLPRSDSFLRSSPSLPNSDDEPWKPSLDSRYDRRNPEGGWRSSLHPQQQQQQQQQQNGYAMGGAVGGGANLIPTAAGHQLDLNHLWGQVQELSNLLERNKESTHGVLQRVGEFRSRARGAGDDANGIDGVLKGLMVNGEGDHGPYSFPPNDAETASIPCITFG